MAAEWPPTILRGTRTGPDADGLHEAFPLVSGTLRDEDGQRGTGSLGLITRRARRGNGPTRSSWPCATAPEGHWRISLFPVRAGVRRAKIDRRTV
jgi:hypothetical protein